MNWTRRLSLVSYDGTFYHGFAKNKEIKTIQGVFEKVLNATLQQTENPQRVSFSSRTDAGVHSLGQPICFDAPEYFEDDTLRRVLNYHLPFPIRVRDLKTVRSGYNLRSCIQKKEYWYVFSTQGQGMILSRYCWVLPHPVSLERVQAGANLLCGTHDYHYFARNARKYDDTECSIESIKIIPLAKVEKKKSLLDFPFQSQSDCYILSVIGDRFLHNQVRRICGFLMHYASLRQPNFGKKEPTTYKDLLRQYSSAATIKAPARGLYLRKVWLSFPSFNSCI